MPASGSLISPTDSRRVSSRVRPSWGRLEFRRIRFRPASYYIECTADRSMLGNSFPCRLRRQQRAKTSYRSAARLTLGISVRHNWFEFVVESFQLWDLTACPARLFSNVKSFKNRTHRVTRV